MEKFGTIDKIMTATVEELSTVEGIGEQLATTIYRYFKESL
jgi:ERCC4-type nuclease